MDPALESVIRQRANGACEYCRLRQESSSIPFENEHIVARNHRGKTVATNMALACFYCNRHKGPNLTGIDPKTGKITRLFHPRRHKWEWHFRWEGAVLVGRTAIGRTTIEVLAINHPDAIAHRESLLEETGSPT
jgi:HNH endonuclease